MIELQEALQIVLDAAQPLGTERVDLGAALGRVLAEDVRADIDMPPFDKATMDGYACRRADLGNALTVVETIPAGAVPTKTIGPNECAKIMTGAVVPPGADCVIMIEQTEQAASSESPARDEGVPPLRPEVGWALPQYGMMRVARGDKGRTPVPSVGSALIRFTGGQTPDNIFRKGQDLRAGQVVLTKGGRIGPQHVAVLASVGCAQPLVAKQPRVGIIASGDELVAPAVRPGPAQIRNSNGPQLAAQLATLGLKARDYGIVKDVASEIDAVLKRALAENDVVIVSAGVSVGDFDLVPAVLRQNHVRLLFEKIAVKPGKPTVFGASEQGYCFGLPGNPVSTFVVFELLVKPFLYKLMGHDYSPVHVQMRLDGTLTRKDTDRQNWNPVRITSEETVEPVQYHGSAHLSALCGAGGLVPMEIGVASIGRGTSVRVRLL
jgi:molybdopterin molybdotransferase